MQNSIGEDGLKIGSLKNGDERGLINGKYWRNGPKRNFKRELPFRKREKI